MAQPLNQPKEKIDFKALFSRFHQALTIALAAIILVVGGYFILWPKYQSVSANSSQVFSALEKEESKRADYVKSLNDLIANYKKVNRQEAGKLKTFLPSDKDFPGLFVQLQGLAEENNFLLSSISINEMPEGAKTAAVSASASASASGLVKKLSININLIGGKVTGYENFKSFLSSLERNLRLFDVEAVYFTPQSVKYSLTLLTYYLPQ